MRLVDRAQVRRQMSTMSGPYEIKPPTSTCCRNSYMAGSRFLAASSASAAREGKRVGLPDDSIDPARGLSVARQRHTKHTASHAANQSTPLDMEPRGCSGRWRSVVVWHGHRRVGPALGLTIPRSMLLRADEVMAGREFQLRRASVRRSWAGGRAVATKHCGQAKQRRRELKTRSAG